MRLIDADKFIESCKEIISDGWNQMSGPSTWAYAYADVIDEIEEQPTIDAIPREELLNILNGRLDFLNKWKDETTVFKKIAEAKIEDCEEIIDIIKPLKMKAIEKCPYCGDAWIYITEENKYKINCRCGFAFKKTPECADCESAKTAWNDIANAKTSNTIPNAE